MPHHTPFITKERMPITAPLGESRHGDQLAGADNLGAPRECAGGAEPRAEHL